MPTAPEGRGANTCVAKQLRSTEETQGSDRVFHLEQRELLEVNASVTRVIREKPTLRLEMRSESECEQP